MVVAVHQARHQYTSAGIDMPIRHQALVTQYRKHFGAAANCLDYLIANNYGPIFNFTPLVIHGDQHHSIVD
jgi:hypothetical protein